MGVRQDKGRALARYLTAASGIPGMSWSSDGIEAPYPYQVEVTTSRKLDNWHEQLRAEPTGRLRLCIRYDNALPDVSAAWVGMSLEDACILLSSHYESIRGGN